MQQSETSLPIEGRFQMTIADFDAISRQVDRRPGRRVLIGATWLFLVASLAYLGWLALHGSAIDQFAAAMPALAIVLVLRLSTPFVQRWIYQRSPLLGRSVRVSADDRFLTLDYETGSQSRTAWNDFRDRTRTTTHLVFWLGRARAVTVPVRAFADAGAAERLWQLAGGIGNAEEGTHAE